jgi:hypothetical protein
VLKGALHLLQSVFQLMVHLVHPIGGGCGQGVQKRSHDGQGLAGPSEGGAWRLLMVCGSNDVPGLSSGVCEVDHYSPLYLECGLAVVLLLNKIVKQRKVI